MHDRLHLGEEAFSENMKKGDIWYSCHWQQSGFDYFSLVKKAGNAGYVLRCVQLTVGKIHANAINLESVSNLANKLISNWNLKIVEVEFVFMAGDLFKLKSFEKDFIGPRPLIGRHFKRSKSIS